MFLLILKTKIKSGSSPVPTTCAATKTMAFGCVHLVPFTNERHDGRSAIGRSRNLGELGQAVIEGLKLLVFEGSHLISLSAFCYFLKP